ncbi:MAG: hypothetical protein WC965_02295 [Thiohalomonadaceae bacterium]
MFRLSTETEFARVSTVQLTTGGYETAVMRDYDSEVVAFCYHRYQAEAQHDAAVDRVRWDETFPAWERECRHRAYLRDESLRVQEYCRKHGI